MFPFKMFLHQRVFQARGISVYLLGEVGHMGNTLQNGAVVNGFIGGFTPGEGGVIAYQYHLYLFVSSRRSLAARRGYP